MRVVLLLVALLSNFTFADELGAIENINPTDADFEDINKKTEFYRAKKGMYEAFHELSKSAKESASTGDMYSGNSSAPGPSLVPRSLRGTSSGDFLLDGKGNLVKQEKRPTAYISTVSGMGGSLSAEIVWADKILSVKRGDSLIGGEWIVEQVNRDDIVIQNGPKRLRIGAVPIDIAELIGN